MPIFFYMHAANCFFFLVKLTLIDDGYLFSVKKGKSYYEFGTCFTFTKRIIPNVIVTSIFEQFAENENMVCESTLINQAYEVHW